MYVHGEFAENQVAGLIYFDKQGPNLCTKFDPNDFFRTAIFISFESIGIYKSASIHYFSIVDQKHV